MGLPIRSSRGLIDNLDAATEEMNTETMKKKNCFVLRFPCSSFCGQSNVCLPTIKAVRDCGQVDECVHGRHRERNSKILWQSACNQRSIFSNAELDPDF